jgi:starch-binding outer membrane protein, SusD/RagB family
MNKLTATLAAGAIALFSASCADLNEEIVTGLTDAYYATPAGFDAVVNATYQPLRTYYGQERGLTQTVFGTDEFTKGADGSYKYFNDYTPQLGAGVDYLRDTWGDFFRAINTANVAIATAPSATLSEATKAIRVGEVRFLRALYFFDLVRTFGDIPLPLAPTDGPSTEATREPTAKVYDAIVADLLAAEAALPLTQSQFGRATKGAAQHLLAKVYLTRAAAGDFQKAADMGKKVIASGTYSLLPRYADLFALGNERNREVIFSVQCTADPIQTPSDPGCNRSHLYFLMEYDVRPGMQRSIDNGRPFKRWMSTPWLYSLWDRSKDTRYQDTYLDVWYSNNAASIPKRNGVPVYSLGDTAIWLPGVEISAAERAARAVKGYEIYTPSQYTNRVFAPVKKFMDPTRPALNEERSQRDWVVMRLAETYLLVAEALVRDGKAAEAVDYVNTVRRRAAKPGVNPADMDVTAAQMNLDFILDERSRELAGEGMRWFDLVRTGKLLERVNKYNPEAAANIKAFHVLRPIPTTQIERTTTAGFTQNPGY